MSALDRYIDKAKGLGASAVKYARKKPTDAIRTASAIATAGAAGATLHNALKTSDDDDHISKRVKHLLHSIGLGD